MFHSNLIFGLKWIDLCSQKKKEKGKNIPTLASKKNQQQTKNKCEKMTIHVLRSFVSVEIEEQ